MDFSPQQDAALQAAAEWIRRRSPQVFRLFGFAGTGKTTLAKYLAELVPGGRVLFAAYTGKAAYVMRTKGCSGASTLHSLIYTCIDEDRDGPQFALSDNSQLSEANLLIIDECSMVDAKLGNDILSFGVPILVLGDPFQLPPVEGAGFFTNAQADFLLTEIHRQALDNPIIRLATTVRKGGTLAMGNHGSSRIISADAARFSELAKSTNQILVGRNVTRRLVNERMRKVLGLYGEVPQPTDRLVCLRNNHLRGLLNGSIWRTHSAFAEGDDILLGVTPDDENGSDAGVLFTKTHLAFFRGTEKEDFLSYEEAAALRQYRQTEEQIAGIDIEKLLAKRNRRDFDEFDFAYGLTVHKAQGSQWSNVAIYDEGYIFDEPDRWLYTAITRAAERITLVQHRD